MASHLVYRENIMNKIPSYTETTIKLFLKSIIIKKHSILKVVNKVNPIEYLCFMSKYTFQSFLTVTITSIFFIYVSVLL